MSTIHARRRGAEFGSWLRTAEASPILDRVLVAGLLALGVALPLAMGLLAGSLEIPRNDDWVYRRISLELAQTGVLALHGVTTMMVGQIVVGQPFLWLSGLQPWGFDVAGVVFATTAVVTSYVLARQFLSPLRAAIATSLLLLFPGYLAYATSFMTDVPALAAEFACLALGAIALRRRPVRNRWLLASAAVGCLAFSIREFAIAAPASVLLAAICAEPRRLRQWGLAIAVASFFGLLYVLKSTLPGQEAGSGVRYGALLQSTYALSSLSLLLLPPAVAGATVWRHEWKSRDVAIGAEMGLLVVGLRAFQLVAGGTMPWVLMHNLASQWGVPAREYLTGGRPLLFGDLAWTIIGFLALGATIVVPAVATGIAGAYIRRSRGSWTAITKRLGSPIGMLVMFSITVAGGLTIYGSRFPLFDRYFWPLVPVMATLFMFTPRRYASNPVVTAPRWRYAFATSLAGLVAVASIVSVIYMLNSFAFDSARWRAGERLVRLGVLPQEVDAGYEWVGYYQPSLPAATAVPPTETFYATLWPGRRQCGIVTSRMEGPAAAELVGTVDYSLFLITGPEERLYLYRSTSPDCTPR